MSEAVPLRAFDALLHSQNLGMVCRALNMYQVAASYTQVSGGNPLEPMAGEVRVVAREILSRPPVEGDPEIPAGFDHVSALNVLTAVAQPEDAELIAQIQATTTDARIQAVAKLASAAVAHSAAPTEEPHARPDSD
jgi:hypothetical protein